MLETAIALIAGFALGYGVREAFPPKASSGKTSAAAFITLSGMTLAEQRVVPSPAADALTAGRGAQSKRQAAER
jgi:hypothetical protein